MIRWLNPPALVALALAAAPIIIHLFRTRRAERIEFPSLRFVRAAETASARIGWPSDLALLALRIALVVASVLAVARPILLTQSRLNAWNERIARAVVLDTSESMSRAARGGPSAAEAAVAAATAEGRGAAYVRRVEDADLRSGLRRALAWVATAPPAQREVVVISDFQQGALGAADIARVPATVGLRFVRVGNAESARTMAGLELLSAPGVPAEQQEIAITPISTAVSVTTGMPDQSGQVQQGLRIIGHGDVQRLLRAVARFGSPAPSALQPIALMFPDSSTALPAAQPVRQRWMLRTILRLRADPSLSLATQETTGSAVLSESVEWTSIATDIAGRPLVSAAQDGPELILGIAAPPTSFIATVVLDAALNARHGDTAQPEEEISSINVSDLSAWSRAPAPVEQDAWRRVEDSDARWFWLAALMLLAVEQTLRRAAARNEEVRLAA